MKDEDIKITAQRELIVKLLVKYQDRHPSADELHQLVRDVDPDVGLATIYRTLDLLERLDLVQTLSLGDGRARYELASGIHRHHHLLCIECGKIEEVDEDLLGAVEEAVLVRAGFKVVDHELKLYGVCSACSSRQKERETSQTGSTLE
ncbi:MAG: transcriptional repressor [Bacillota bacterium]